MAYIDILVPNLLDAVRRLYDSGDPTALRIARGLAYGERIDTIESSFEESVLSTFGISGEGQGPPTVAGLTASYDLEIDYVPTEWLRADPVHLLADGNRLIFFGPEMLDLEGIEADCLLELLRSNEESVRRDGMYQNRILVLLGAIRLVYYPGRRLSHIREIWGSLSN